MCDTACVISAGGTLFAKNSDRPVTEAQVVERHPRRPAGAGLHTQYLEIEDPGACAVVVSRPTWLWGAEHGVNEHRVAIGNEMVHTVDDPRHAPPALLGMDLVRLGLERATTAEHALVVMTELLEKHGQGGVGDAVNALSYWSSFLIADPRSAWVLETSGRAWAARPVRGGDAISNRLTMRTQWTRASPGVAPGTDLDTWRDPFTSTGFTDGRLAAGRAFVARRQVVVATASEPSPSAGARAAAAHLRDHGTGPWGAPGEHGPVVPAPGDTGVDGAGVTVCMHVHDFETTTAAMVAELPVDPDHPARLWVALGNPCSSVFVPAVVPGPAPGDPPVTLGGETLARRTAAVSRAAERDGELLAAVRGVLGPLEGELWDEADAIGAEPGPWDAFAVAAQRRLAGALDALAVTGIGVSA